MSRAVIPLRAARTFGMPCCARTLSVFTPAVPQAIQGFDPVEALVFKLELCPDAPDVAVDGTVTHVRVLGERLREELLPRPHAAAVPRQGMQDAELGHGKPHGRPPSTTR